MAGFRKAKAEQAALKIGLYGPAGSGKTLTSLLIAEGLAAMSGKRVAFVDTEHGTDFYCQEVKQRDVHPAGFDFDCIYTRSITEVLNEVRRLSPDEYDVIVLDSVTHLWEAAMAAYDGKKTRIGTIPVSAWGRIKKPYKELMAFLLSTSMHVVICGRQKTVYETDEETDEMKAAGVAMRAEGETAYEPHILFRMEAIRPKKTNEKGQIVAYCEKDRTGILGGRSYINPSFDTLCKPVLGLLGKSQAQIMDLDATAAIDAEEIERQEQERELKSAVMRDEFIARITLCKDASELKNIGKEITPQVKSVMCQGDLADVRESYKKRETALGQVA